MRQLVDRSRTPPPGSRPLLGGMSGQTGREALSHRSFMFAVVAFRAAPARKEGPMVKKIAVATSAALAITAGTLLGSGGFASAGSGSSGNEAGRASANKPIRFEQHDLYIEFNASAGDAGLQLGADAESWKRFTLYDTEGRVLIHIGSRGRLRRPFGLSELFLEASEPGFTEVPFNKFKRRFPEGRYRFRGGDLERAHAGRLRPAVAPDPRGSERHLPDGGRACRPRWVHGLVGPSDGACGRRDRDLPGHREPGRPRAEHVRPPRRHQRHDPRRVP